MKKWPRGDLKDTAETNLTLKNEIVGIVFFFISVFLLLSFISYSPLDPSPYTSPADSPGNSMHNYGGKIGAYISSHFFQIFGFTAFFIICFLFLITFHFFSNKSVKYLPAKSFSSFVFLISLASLLSNFFPNLRVDKIEIHSGGILGHFINEFLVDQLRGFFAVFLLLILITVCVIIFFKLSIKDIGNLWFKIQKFLIDQIKKIVKNQWERFEKYKRINKIKKKYDKYEEPETQEKKESLKDLLKQKKKIVRKPSKIPEEKTLFDDNDDELTLRVDYSPPPLSYLDAPRQEDKVNYNELEKNKDELLGRLFEFNIKGKIQEYTPGPVITTYEFVPESGIKVKNVVNLSEDLALVAKTQYVRIERILGKKAIGIEIPNKNRELIALREILESDLFIKANSPLTIGLGKSKNGEIFVTDLRQMPHLIIAGATGSGKSVAVHSVLLSILYKSSPEMVKLILIDPKRVELAVYNSIPHLLTPVVVNMKLAKNALDWSLWEMEQRYKKLAKVQARNIDQYNNKLELIKQNNDDLNEDLVDLEKMPYIVIVIDEFADLIMECGRDVEENVARLAQKARATGIHIILATQRPSIDVITGTIKNNFPSRIAMAVPSKFDSRTIIDSMGAEKLLGKGDMLFLPPQTASLVRLHGAFVSETEVLRVVKFLSKMQKQEFDKTITKPQQDSKSSSSKKQAIDSMFYEAARLIIGTGHASASFLQRRLRLGYARAGRLIDQLVEHNIISEADSKNKREVLMSMKGLDELQNKD